MVNDKTVRKYSIYNTISDSINDKLPLVYNNVTYKRCPSLIESQILRDFINILIHLVYLLIFC